MTHFLQTKFYSQVQSTKHKGHAFCLNQGLDHSVLLLALGGPSNITALPRKLQVSMKNLSKTTDPNKKLAQTLTFFFWGGGGVTDQCGNFKV